MKFLKIPVVLCALVALTAFAGCIGGDDNADPVEATENEPPAKSDEVEVSDATGSIRGEAMNVDLDPVAGAEVVLVETVGTEDEKSATVAKDGSFVINGVAPGTYTVYVQAVMHNAARKAVDVKAGEVTQVSLMLEKIVDPTRPYQDVREYAGIIQYGASWQIEVPGMGCVVQNAGPREVKTCSGIRVGSSSDNGEVAIEIPDVGEVQTIFAALQWNPAGPLGESLSFDLMCTDTPRHEDSGAVLDTEHPCYFETPSTTSPIVHRVDKEHWDEHGYNQTGDWAARVFGTYGMLGTYDLTGIDAGAAYQQKFMIYTEVWMNEPAPADYSPLPDA